MRGYYAAFGEREWKRLEGLASGIESLIVDLRDADPSVFNAVLKVIIETATEPSLLGAAKHLMYVGHRP